MSRDPPLSRTPTNDNDAPDVDRILALIEDGTDPFVEAVREVAERAASDQSFARAFKAAIRSADPIRAEFGRDGLVMLVRLLFDEHDGTRKDADVLAATCLRDPEFFRARTPKETAPQRGGAP